MGSIHERFIDQSSNFDSGAPVAKTPAIPRKVATAEEREEVVHHLNDRLERLTVLRDESLTSNDEAIEGLDAEIAETESELKKIPASLQANEKEVSTLQLAIHEIKNNLREKLTHGTAHLESIEADLDSLTHALESLDALLERGSTLMKRLETLEETLIELHKQVLDATTYNGKVKVQILETQLEISQAPVSPFLITMTAGHVLSVPRYEEQMKEQLSTLSGPQKAKFEEAATRLIDKMKEKSHIENRDQMQIKLLLSQEDVELLSPLFGLHELSPEKKPKII